MLSRPMNRVVFMILLLTAAAVPLVYYNNPIATEYFFVKALFGNGLVYLALALFFLDALRRRELTVTYGRTFLALAVFLVICVQSLLGAENPWKGWETILRVGAAFPFLFLLFQVTETRQDAYRLLRVVALANIIITAYGFLQYYEVFPLPRDQYGTADPSSTIGLTNFAMEYMSVFMFIFPVMIWAEQRATWRLLFTLASLTQFYYFLISGNRAAMVGFTIALPVALLLAVFAARRGRLRLTARGVGIFGAGAAALAAILLFTPVGHNVERRFESIFAKVKDDSITFRLETWRQTVEIFKKNPIRGVGLSNLEIVFPAHFSPYLEWMTLRKNTRVTTVHNEYLQALGDLGILGFAAFAWFLGILTWVCIRAYRRAQEKTDTGVVIGLLAGLVMYLVIAFFAFPFNIPSSNLSFFLTVGLVELFDRRFLEEGDEPKLRLHGGAVLPVMGTALLLTLAFWVYAELWMLRALKAEVNFKEARIMKDFGRPDVGKELLDEAIRMYPQNEAYYFDRAYYSLQEGKLDQALYLLRMTAKLVPNYAVGHKQIGLILAQRGDFASAAESFKRAYAIYRTQHAEYVPLLVNAYLAANKPAEALAVAEKPIQDGTTDANLYYHYGRALQANQRFDDAVKALQTAHTAKPAEVEIQVQLGSALSEAGKYKEALEQLDSVSSEGLTAEERFALLSARGRAYVGLGRLKEAREAVLAATSVNPKGKERLKRDKVFNTVPELKELLNGQ